MGMIAIICIGIAFILLIKNIKLKAYLEGFREAQQYAMNNAANRSTRRDITTLVIIGLFMIGGICFYVGLAAATMSK
ncbi:MAG: hypothetical protein JXR84_19775 [Anaerolineae bacterium]|nr:hypothetical protein [Anaerolineae bacterium]